jgi:hypothetical protein
MYSASKSYNDYRVALLEQRNAMLSNQEFGATVAFSYLPVFFRP